MERREYVITCYPIYGYTLASVININMASSIQVHQGRSFPLATSAIDIDMVSNIQVPQDRNLSSAALVIEVPQGWKLGTICRV